MVKHKINYCKVLLQGKMALQVVCYLYSLFRGVNSTGKRNKNHVHFVLANSNPCIWKEIRAKLCIDLYEVELLLLLL